MINLKDLEERFDENSNEQDVRKYLYDNSQHVMAVKDPIRVVIKNLEAEEKLVAQNHPQNASMGTRELMFTKDIFIERSDFDPNYVGMSKKLVLGGEVRLRHGYVIKAESMEMDDDGKVSKVFCTYDPDTLGESTERKVKGVIHWVSADHCLDFTINVIYTTQCPWIKALTEYFVSSVDCVAERSLLNCDTSCVFNVMRLGYFYLDHDKNYDLSDASLTPFNYEFYQILPLRSEG